tara:strand:- start:348 stop:635 length:288 start_codon:yes stop_codon:yes gene_type:complete
MKPDKLRVLVKNAAEKIYYPQCLKHIEGSMPKEFHALARATLIYYLPSQIADLQTKKERREAINSIPEIADPIHTKEFITNGVKAIWKKRVRVSG